MGLGDVIFDTIWEFRDRLKHYLSDNAFWEYGFDDRVEIEKTFVQLYTLQISVGVGGDDDTAESLAREAVEEIYRQQ